MKKYLADSYNNQEKLVNDLMPETHGPNVFGLSLTHSLIYQNGLKYKNQGNPKNSPGAP